MPTSPPSSDVGSGVGSSRSAASAPTTQKESVYDFFKEYPGNQLAIAKVTIPKDLPISDQKDILLDTIYNELKKGNTYFLLARALASELSGELKNALEGKIKVLTFAEEDSFGKDDGTVAIVVSYDPSPPHEMSAQNLATNIMDALKDQIVEIFDRGTARDLNDRSGIEIQFRDPQAKKFHRNAKAIRGKIPDFSLHHNSVRPGTDYPVIYGESAYCNKNEKELLNELRALIEGTPNNEIKVAIGQIVRCIRYTNGWEVPQILLWAVSRNVNEDTVICHGPLLFTRDGLCQTAGMRDFKVKFRLRPFFRGTEQEEAVQGIWAEIDLFEVAVDINKDLASTALGLQDTVPELDNEWVIDAEQITEEYCQRFNLVRAETLADDSQLQVSFKKSVVHRGTLRTR